MLRKSLFALTIAILSLAQTALADLTVTFDYTHDTTGFFGVGTAARGTLEAAGNFYATLLQDNLTDITPSGTNSWSAGYYNPSSGVWTNSDDLVVGTNELIVYVGSRDLGVSTLGEGGPGGYSVSGSEQSWFTNVIARGQGSIADVENDGANKTAIDFGPWGGSLSINDQVTWNLDHTLDPSGSENDLLSVVLHELGHLMGIGTADSWANLIVGTEFTGAQSVAEHGGNVPLESDLAHWEDGTTSAIFPNGSPQDAAMDPIILVGTRKVFTDLDVAGLDDLGWDTVPEPASIFLASFGAIFLVLVYRRQQRGTA